MKSALLPMVVGSFLVSSIFFVSSISAQVFDNQIPMRPSNELTISIGGNIAPDPTVGVPKSAPGPEISIGNTDTVTVNIGGVISTPNVTQGHPIPTVTLGSTPGSHSGDEDEKKKEKKRNEIRKKEQKLIEKLKERINRVDHIWEQAKKRIKKMSNKKNYHKLVSRAKSVDRRREAVMASVASLQEAVKQLSKSNNPRSSGKEFIKKFRKAQSRLQSYKNSVEDVIHDIKSGG